MRNWNFVALFLLVFFLPSANSTVKYLELYGGLPNYDEQPAFTVTTPEAHNNLRNALLRIRADTNQCKMGEVKIAQDWGILSIDLWSNVCDAKSFNTLKGLVSKLAPGLHSDRISFWITNLDGDKEPDLLVGHIDVSEDKDAPYPYFSLWRLRFEKGTYRAVYAGPFLNGNLHAIRLFGTNPERKAVFVKHVNCIECEPIVYLTAIDFDAGKDASAYEFTYSNDHQGFAPSIEYELPGMGHTVDATVETRLLPPTENGPHVLQFFDMEEGEGPDEWWAFTCKNYRCDYQIYKSEPPSEFIKLWKTAKKL